MEIYLVKMFGISLILTLLVELIVAFLFQWRRHKLILLVILVNLLTNPPAVLLSWLGRLYLPPSFLVPIQLFVELLVIMTEAFIYCRFSRAPGWPDKQTLRPIRLAVVSNMCSWLLGILYMNR